MLKAVFIDYTGTIMKEAGKDVEEMTMRLYKNSDIESPQAMLNYWWGKLKKYENESFGDAFLTEDEIVDKLLADCVEELNLQENLEEAHELCRLLRTPSHFLKIVRCPYTLSLITASVMWEKV